MGLGRVYQNLVEKDIDFFLGHVVQVHLNESDSPRGGESSVSSQAIKVKPLDSSLPTMSQIVSAVPLIRGISDSITKGDLVLMTLIYESFYYIGPLNSFNTPNVGSNPTWSKRRDALGSNDYDIESSIGYGSAYPVSNVPKLQKNRNVVLDGLPNDYYHNSKHTDLSLEGRHGNSIRLGSRDIFPILNLHNTNIPVGTENPMVGSLLSFMSNGSIEQNLGFFRLSTDSSVTLPNTTAINPNFQINKGNSKLLNNIEPTEGLDTFYNFSQEIPEQETKTEFDQILITSDRLIFNSRSNVGDISISSGRNINLGAAVNFTLNNQGQSVINSGNIYLGEKARDKKEPMVLGDELRALLLKFAEILQDSRALVQGVPIPLYDRESGSPMFSRIQSLITELTPQPDGERPNSDTGVYKESVTKFLSKKHFIETNTDRSNNNEG